MRTISVSETIDGRGLSRFQLFTIVLCGCVVVLDGFDTQVIGFLVPAMADEFKASPASFATAFSAALIGLMVGSLILGPVADRIGRRWPVIGSTIVFAVFTLMTPLVANVDQLALIRFMTGLGLGGAMPNLVALATEYAPKRLQPTVVAWMFAGVPIGAVMGGAITALVLPAWGWRGVFYIGALLPGLIAILLLARLPESIRFLVVRRAPRPRVVALLRRIAPDLPIAEQDQIDVPVATTARVPMRELFADGRWAGTILLWIPYFMNLLMIYFVVSWFPVILRQAHLPLSLAIQAITLFSIGGAVGCVVTGRLLRTIRTSTVVLTEFICAVAAIVALTALPTTPVPIMTAAALLGFVVQGAQAGLNAMVAEFYPTRVRATGVGWAYGFGRIGSVAGPLLGGLMLSLGWSMQSIFLAGTIPALCAALSVLVGMTARSRPEILDPVIEPAD